MATKKIDLEYADAFCDSDQPIIDEFKKERKKLHETIEYWKNKNRFRWPETGNEIAGISLTILFGGIAIALAVMAGVGLYRTVATPGHRADFCYVSYDSCVEHSKEGNCLRNGTGLFGHVPYGDDFLINEIKNLDDARAVAEKYNCKLNAN